MERYFACENCGQVYINTVPEKCMSIYNCNSTIFTEISKDDVIDMHDVPVYIVKRLFQKFIDILKVIL